MSLLISCGSLSLSFFACVFLSLSLFVCVCMFVHLCKFMGIMSVQIYRYLELSYRKLQRSGGGIGKSPSICRRKKCSEVLNQLSSSRIDLLAIVWCNLDFEAMSYSWSANVFTFNYKTTMNFLVLRSSLYNVSN